jgi:hypothetical protein
MRATVLAACAAFACVTLAARAADESGPKAGEKPPAFKTFSVVGTSEGKEVDFVAERKDEPTIYIFVQAEEGGIPVGGRPAARFLKVLDDKIGDVSDKTAIVAVWLGDKAFEKHKEYLPRIAKSLTLQKTSLTAFDGNKSGPNNWAISSDVHLTVVLVNRGKVAKSFALTSVNETDVKPVLEELKKAVGK